MFEVSLKELMKGGFPGWLPGDLLTSSAVGAWITKPIMIAESRAGGLPAERTHSMIYAGAGNVISQDWRIREKPLSEYLGATLSLLSNPAWDAKRRTRLIAEVRLHLGRWYDVPGILGQLLTSVTGVQWFADHIQATSLTYCSEFVCGEVRRHIDSTFMADRESCQVTPDQMDRWCIDAGWKAATIILQE